MSNCASPLTTPGVTGSLGDPVGDQTQPSDIPGTAQLRLTPSQSLKDAGLSISSMPNPTGLGFLKLGGNLLIPAEEKAIPVLSSTSSKPSEKPSMTVLSPAQSMREVADSSLRHHGTIASFAEGVSDCSSFPMNYRTTHYTEDIRSFVTSEASHVLSRTGVVETPNVIIRRTESEKFINNYRVIKLLGKGSFGKVKLVESTVSGCSFAMKIIKLNGNQNRQKREVAIQREVAVMKCVKHPHLVRLFEVLGDTSNGKLYMILQYISGGSIATKKTEFTIHTIPEVQLRRNARQLLSALKYLEMNVIVHRDIKPENILVDHKNDVFLADFGLSAFCADEVVSGVEGTPAFMSPEVCRGDAEVTGHLVDVWALGVSLFQLMYGVLPFVAPNMPELTRVIVCKELTFPDEDPSIWINTYKGICLDPVCPSKEFKVFIRGTLEKDPNKRWGIKRALQCEWINPV